jgi:hypothetical protein
LLKVVAEAAIKITAGLSELREPLLMKHNIGSGGLIVADCSRIKQVETLKPLIDELAPRLNAFLKSIGPSERDSKATDH